MSPSLGALLLTAAAGAVPAPHVEILPGDLELVVLPVAGARTASLRYVVRSGAAHGPASQAGLAHLVEHLLVKEAGGPVGLMEASRAAGATLNAFTTRDATLFALDAPAAGFEALAERYLRAITGPTFLPASIDRELGVVQNEQGAAGNAGVLGHLDTVLFRSSQAEESLLGRAWNRAEITREALLAFFQGNYLTSNTTVVLTGAVTPASARALVDRAVLLPPALPGERVAPRPGVPSLPVTEKLRAPFLGAALGYLVDPADHATCEALAGFVELRLLIALQLREPLLRSLSVDCHSFRGAELLLAIAFSPTLDATDLPLAMERIMMEVGSGPPRPGERVLLELRRGRLRDRLAGDPEALAEAVGWAAARPRESGRTPLPSLAPEPLPVQAMQAAARRALQAERRVLLLLSPFEG